VARATSSPKDSRPDQERDRREVWTETRERIIDAARTLFSERGYQATTTKELAEAAGVAEITLFRHFPTKAQLFEKASIEPIHDFIERWIERWKTRPFGSRDVPSEGDVFFDELLTLLEREQRLIPPMLDALTDADGGGRVSPETREKMSRPPRPGCRGVSGGRLRQDDGRRDNLAASPMGVENLARVDAVSAAPSGCGPQRRTNFDPRR
jgi:AcrR family transcriptional regulator